MSTSSVGEAVKANRGGRKRDGSRDGVILDAAIQILAEAGYDRMTMDMVAARAKAGKGTVYRRWASKREMVLEAVARMKREQVDLDALPDTGTLRGDILALFRPKTAEENARKFLAMMGLASLLTQEEPLAGAAGGAIAGPWTAAILALMERARSRGEIGRDAPVATLCAVIPSLGAYRILVHRTPFEREFLVEMLDHVVLPALGLRPEA